MHVLGISCFYHDGGAALVHDGELVAAAEQERFSRNKHDSAFPDAAIDYCLREAGITVDDVDYIGFYEKPFIKAMRILETILAGWPRTYWPFVKATPLWLKSRLRIGRIIQKSLKTDQDIIFGDHHLSHAASAFLVSPFDEAAILTADGVGEWCTTAWGVGKGTAIELQKQIRFPHSAGLLFSAITAYLGFRVNDAEWKVMGLAPYGKPTYVDAFRKVVDIKDDGSIRFDMKYFAHTYSTRSMISRRWERLFGQPRRHPESELTPFHEDIAHSGQKIVEEIMVRTARHVQRSTGQKNLCMAGGVALNCVANWRILQETDFERIFIQPAAGDSGGAVGTAFYIYNTLLKRPRRFVMRNACTGPAFSDDEIRKVLTARGARFEAVDDEPALLRRTAKLIAHGKIVGWFQGRMEFGPRALGARSILADPRDESAKDRINAKVKFREAFRPFAPAVLREHAHEYFDMPEGMDAPFMLLVPLVRADKRTRIPAVTHRDGTGRVQTLTEDDNGRFYRLVDAFRRQTGVPVLVNTSFNVRGEPIVCTPEHAYNTFVKTGLDALVIGNNIVTEKPQSVDYDAGMQRSIALEAGTTAPVT